MKAEKAIKNLQLFTPLKMARRVLRKSFFQLFLFSLSNYLKIETLRRIFQASKGKMKIILLDDTFLMELPRERERERETKLNRKYGRKKS